MTLTALAEKINATSTAHGFWPQDKMDALEALSNIEGNVTKGGSDVAPEEFNVLRRFIEAQAIRNLGEMLMLATSELAEALEEHRDGRPPVYFKINIPQDPEDISPGLTDLIKRIKDGDAPALDPEQWKQLVSEGVAKPEGVAVELIDCIIRCLDTAHDVLKDVPYDIDSVAELKMMYNDSRPFKHGRSY